MAIYNGSTDFIGEAYFPQAAHWHSLSVGVASAKADAARWQRLRFALTPLAIRES